MTIWTSPFERSGAPGKGAGAVETIVATIAGTDIAPRSAFPTKFVRKGYLTSRSLGDILRMEALTVIPLVIAFFFIPCGGLIPRGSFLGHTRSSVRRQRPQILNERERTDPMAAGARPRWLESLHFLAEVVKLFPPWIAHTP